jgi:hypothetical protein
MADKEIWKHNEDAVQPSPEDKTTESRLDSDILPVASSDVETITVSNITGHLVIFYGPADVGKTVTLLRLCSFVAAGYTVEIDRNFRSDNGYDKTVNEFERQRKAEIFAPLSTGAIDFILANVTLRGTAFCQILEAPGEHFFPKTADLEVSHPYYLQTIFQSPIRKIFALFFETNLMNNDKRLRAYVTSILNVLRQHADPGRDRVLIIFNKCDERPDLNRNGRPVEKEFKRLLYSSPAFAPLAEFLKANRFARVHFVPFSSGQFGKDRTGRRTFAMSAKHYPQSLWNAIHDCVEGRSRFWLW